MSGSESSFQYEPLDRTQDCIRLIEMEPISRSRRLVSREWHLDVKCTIKQVAFSERPKYEALSYMWGNSSDQRDIEVNGKRFRVTENLYHALWFLRARATGKHLQFWIDAICINQADVDEKTTQIRLMPHVYFRAQTVLVWLGADWLIKGTQENEEWLSASKCEMKALVASLKEKMMSLGYFIITSMPSEPDAGDTLRTMIRAYSRNSLRWRMLGAHEIYQCEYWDRLWIIQEIGKAARIEVGLVATVATFGGARAETNQYSLKRIVMCTSPWDGLIEGIVKILGKDKLGGPIRLDQQLRQRYEGKHTLRALLETHKDAKCGVLHDKIYGLVGLAEDSYGFAIDYRKSQFDVWKDAILFLNPVDDESVAHLASLCSHLLGASARSVGLPEQLATSVAASRDSFAGSGVPLPQRLFPLGLTLIGTIAHVGPNPEDVVKYTEMADYWNTSIKRNYGNTGLSDIARENDNLIKALLTSREENLRTFVVPLPFGDPLEVQLIGDWSPSALQQRSPVPAPLLPLPRAPRESIWEHRLYQLDAKTRETALCSLGVTTACVQEGDIVCRVRGTRKHLLLRQEDEGKWRILGTAWSPHEAEMLKLRGEETATGDSLDLRIGVDIDMLYTVFSPRLDVLLYNPVWGFMDSTL
ncbi:heterokaryon incompatibility protein-domain-containing protein [Cercophora newfieldiana]|uniref:Heterokaryon incompatibility protein-domain-containing protein n=1 Tax=Cercophora newfieldiana TaxID=92897 RepID=A0AA39Y228_9PEZI|nr:heterokaryon incompatibility protein-domain-containing protein [Cercophora newfieldiana]